jgi:uncharacterized damage-inducible protein DinB
LPDLTPLVTSTLAEYYQEIREKLHERVAPLSTEQIWRKPYPYGNSIGHLVLHITGNLNHYIGARIASTGYIRNRPLEFADPSQPPKETILASFDRTIDLVVTTIRKQSAEELVMPYSDPTEERSRTRFQLFTRMAAHAYHHVGQIIYLAQEVSRP